MKNLFFILIFALCSYTTKPLLQPFYMQIHYAPVLVYGSTSELTTAENGFAKGKLTIKEVIKGDISGAKTIDIVFIPKSRNKRLPKKVFSKMMNETRIFSLYQDKAKVWIIANNLGLNVNANHKIESFYGGNDYRLGTNSPTDISISDFKAGIALFEQKYTYFNEKKANGIKISLENPTQNKTFAFLAEEMMGELIYIPKTVRKTQKTKVKSSKKRK
jgi:hypothetical protein